MATASGQRRLGAWLVAIALLVLIILWTIPTLGIFISSFRHRDDISTSGWWTVLPHREWQTVAELDPRELGLDATAEMSVEGVVAATNAGVISLAGRDVEAETRERLQERQAEGLDPLSCFPPDSYAVRGYAFQ